MHFLKLIIFIIGILNISNISKADYFLGNCNIGNEREYFNTAFKLMDKFNFNFKANMSKEKLIYCKNVSQKSSLPGSGLTFTIIPYDVFEYDAGRGALIPNYIDIYQLPESTCVQFSIIESFVVDNNWDYHKLIIFFNPETGKSSKWSSDFKFNAENCTRTNKKYFDKNSP